MTVEAGSKSESEKTRIFLIFHSGTDIREASERAHMRKI